MIDGHRARRRFSQNFLHDASVIARIVTAIDPRPGDRLVEIGPGLGALTAPLIEGAGHMTAIEIDRDLSARLAQRFSAEQLALINADALAVDWVALARDPLGSARTAALGHEAVDRIRPLRIVGNLPYHISTPLLFALLPAAHLIRDQHFMLQKEVVDRIVAAPGGKDYGRLSVMLQFRYRVSRVLNVAAGSFSPAPKVASSVVRLLPHDPADLPAVDLADFARVVTAAFGQRRKTLRNALSEVLREEGIRAAGVDPSVRAERLPVAAFVALTEQVAGTAHGSATG